MCYDATNPESFDGVKRWLSEIGRLACENINIMIAGTKIDMADKVDVSSDAARDLADACDASFVECSAKDNICVDEMFDTITGIILERITTVHGIN